MRETINSHNFIKPVCISPIHTKANEMNRSLIRMGNAGVQRINNVFHIVDKVENMCLNKYIFDLNDNVEYVVYALYSRMQVSIITILNFHRSRGRAFEIWSR